MSTLQAQVNGICALDPVTLYVWLTPDGSGKLHGGLYDYRYSHRTLIMRPNASLSIRLADTTGLKLVLQDFLTTAPQCITLVQPEDPNELTILEANDLVTGLLVFFSIVLESSTPGTPVVLCCDPQVGNDPKVSPT